MKIQRTDVGCIDSYYFKMVYFSEKIRKREVFLFYNEIYVQLKKCKERKKRGQYYNGEEG